jgi:hypothetical protein
MDALSNEISFTIGDYFSMAMVLTDDDVDLTDSTFAGKVRLSSSSKVEFDFDVDASEHSVSFVASLNATKTAMFTDGELYNYDMVWYLNGKPWTFLKGNVKVSKGVTH